MISSRSTLLVLCALSVVIEGCKGCAEEQGETSLLVAIDGAASGVWVGDGWGAGQATVPVLVTNSLGAAVGGVDVTFSSDGAVDPTSATMPADGWTTATVTGERGLWSATATLADGVTSTGRAWSVGEGPGALEYQAWPTGGTATAAAMAGKGAAWSVGDTIWWAAGDDTQPVRVAQLPGDVRALLPVAVDGDGVTDVLAWSDTTVVLLRGRDGGGLSWGAGWSTGGATIGGATVSSRGGDADADVVVATEDAGLGRVEVLEGDGVWGFQLASVFAGVPFIAYGVSVEDVDADGAIELTLLTEDGLLRRFTQVDGLWASTSVSAEYNVGVGPGSVLLPAQDLNDDDVEDVIAVGPLLDSDGWQVSIATVGGDSSVVYAMFSGDGDYAPPDSVGVGVGDLTGDGVNDLALSAPNGRLHRAAWYLDEDQTAPSFHLQTFTVMPSGAAAVGDLDGDLVADVFVAGAGLGVLVPGERTDTDLWRPKTPDTVVFGLRAALTPWVGELSGDGLADVVAFQRGEAEGVWTDELILAGWRGQLADTGPWLRSGGTASLAETGGEPLDLAVCGSRAYALWSAAGATTLARFDLGDTVAPTRDGDPIVVDAVAVACGDFGDYEVVAFSEGGDSTWVMPDGTAVQGATYADGVIDAAAYDPDGDGVDQALVCSEDDCVARVGDLDGDGMDDTVVWTSSAGLEVTMGGVPYLVDDLGVPSVADVDGDGVDDLVLGLQSATVVHQAASGGVGPGVGRYVWRPTEGAVTFGDLSGDGVPDALFFGADLSEVDAPVWEGTMVLAPAVVE